MKDKIIGLTVVSFALLTSYWMYKSAKHSSKQVREKVKSMLHDPADYQILHTQNEEICEIWDFFGLSEQEWTNKIKECINFLRNDKF